VYRICGNPATLSEISVTRCIDENIAAAYVQGTLTPAEVADVDQHADSCSRCRQFISELVRALGPSATRVPTPTEPVYASTNDSSSLNKGHKPLLLRGATLERYMMLDRIDANRMGVVYAAFDPELDRKVALKLLRTTEPAATSARLRLLREAQALARLSHSNVVTVYDIGSWQEQVFLAMEFIDGWTVSAWLREKSPDAAEVLRVFRAAGRGLAAAHAAGIIHRDFKPDNVLVGRDGRVCVTDFGLARAAAVRPGDYTGGETPSTGARAVTQSGAVLGTPRYMAPEQRDGQVADARSDQYSYCVALWEALYGALPAAVEVPHKAKRARGKAAGPAARARPVLVRGLSAEPSGRWPSMDELLSRLARKPRLSLGRVIAAAALTGVLISLVWTQRYFDGRRTRLCRGGQAQFATIWSPERKASARAAVLASGLPYVAAVADHFEQTIDKYQRAWTAMHVEACEATRVTGHQPEDVLGLRMACLTSRLEEVDALVQRVTRGDTPVERLSSAVTSLSPITSCADVAGLSAPIRPPADPEIQKQVDALRHELIEATADAKAGRDDAALKRETRVHEEAKKIGYAPLVAEAKLSLGRTQAALGQLKAAEDTLYEAAYAAEAGHHDVIAAEAWLELVETLGFVLDRPAEARRIARQAEAAIARLLGRRRDMEAHLLDALSGIAFREKDWPLAEDSARRCLALSEQVFAPDDDKLAAALINYAIVLRQLGRTDKVMDIFVRARAINEKVFGANHPRLATDHFSLGTAHLDLGHSSEAIAEFRRSIALAEQRGPEYLDLGGFSVGLGDGLSSIGDHQGAQAAFERGIRILAKALGPEHDDLAEAYFRFSEALAVAGKWPQALAHARRSVAIQEKVGPERRQMAWALAAVGGAQLGLGRAREALAWYERGLRIGNAAKASDRELAALRFGLARALWLTGRDRARARSLAAEAARAIAEVQAPSGVRMRREIGEWLASHTR
jgi:eukaryotic-like serine/threonine-protein kinase